MPVYEFYCADCHTVYQFLSKRILTDARPACPRCGRADLRRQVSPFASPRGAREAPADGPLGDVDATRLERAMASLESEMGGLDEKDPRQMARFLRTLSEAAGIRAPGMDEAVRRMEAGEDPEKIEEELGPLFGDGEAGDAGGDDPAVEASTAPRSSLGGHRLRRLLPPARDEKLYPLE